MKSAVLNEQNYQFKTNIIMKTKTSILALTKAFFILLVSCCLFYSCTHPRSGEIVRDKDGNYYELSDEQLMFMPTNAYRLHQIDTTKYKVVGFK